MTQFDSPTEAVVARLKSEELHGSSLVSHVDRAATVGGIILESLGVHGASSTTKLFSVLSGLASGKDKSNLNYFGEVICDDIRRLYKGLDELGDKLKKSRLDSMLHSEEFTTLSRMQLCLSIGQIWSQESSA